MGLVPDAYQMNVCMVSPSFVLSDCVVTLPSELPCPCHMNTTTEPIRHILNGSSAFCRWTVLPVLELSFEHCVRNYLLNCSVAGNFVCHVQKLRSEDDTWRMSNCTGT